MVAYLASVGLQVHEAELFFQIMTGSDTEGEVSIDRFVEGCMQMKGTATGVDMQKVLFEMHLLMQQFETYERESRSFMHKFLAKLQDFYSSGVHSQPSRTYGTSERRNLTAI